MTEDSQCKKFSVRVIRNWKEKTVKNPFTNRTVRFYTRTFDKLSYQCNLYNDCKVMKGLSNYKSFSCYLDSTLFLLLAVENRYVDRYILFKELSTTNVGRECFKTDPQKNLKAIMSIQDELQKLCFEIRHGIYLPTIQCKNFLKILRDSCKETSYPKFYKAQQRAPNDFLSFLFEIFDIDRHMRLTIIQRNSYKRTASQKHFMKKYNTVTETKNAHCIWNVPVTLLQQPTSMKKLLVVTEEDVLDTPIYHEKDTEKKHPLYYYRTTRFFKNPPPFLVMELTRIDPITGKFVDTAILPDQHIKSLNLYGVIVHVGYVQQKTSGVMGSIGSGHYIAYFLCKGKWFEFNDCGASITHIGTYKDLLSKTDVAKKGVLYFYSR